MTLKMEDIARLAHVSRSSVSIALNNKPGISQEKREKIFEVINKYGYQPLRKSKKGLNRHLAEINLLVVNKTSGLINENYRSLPFFDNLISALSKRVSSFGGTLKINSLQLDELKEDVISLDKKKQLGPTLVLGTDLNSEDVIFLNKSIKNVVFVDTYFPQIAANFVTMDNYQGGYMVGKELTKRGFTRIGYAASNQWISNFQERQRGFYDALKEAKINVDPANFYTISPTKILPEKDELTQILRAKLPEVLFCEDDYIAIRLIKGLLKEKLSIPEDLSIVGFDDIYAGTLVTPELTTVHVQIDQIVDQAILQLQNQVFQNNWEPQKILVATKFIERESL